MKQCKIVWASIINQHSHLPQEIQLNLFQWMIMTGWYNRGAEQCGVFEWLYGISARNAQNYSFEYGFKSYQDVLQILPRAFARMITDSHPPASVLNWREQLHVGMKEPHKMLALYDEKYTLSDADLLMLFGYTGSTLQTQLNVQQPEANLIQSVLLTPAFNGWQIRINYGIPNDLSTWHEYLLPVRTMSVAAAVQQAIEKLATL